MNDNPKTKKESRYITEVKETPPSHESEAIQNTKDTQAVKENTPPENQVQEKTPQSEEKAEMLLKNPEKKQEVKKENEVKTVKKSFPLTARDIILNVINLIAVVLLVILLKKFPQNARDLNRLRTESIKNESGVSFEFGEVDTYEAKAQELNKLFLDDSGIVNFVNEVENLKDNNPAIQKISFTSNEVIKDKTGNYGTPIVIELAGSWEEIENAIIDIQQLPYLFRAVNVSAKEKDAENEDETKVIQFNYGGFLYVNSTLGKN